MSFFPQILGLHILTANAFTPLLHPRMRRTMLFLTSISTRTHFYSQRQCPPPVANEEEEENDAPIYFFAHIHNGVIFRAHPLCHTFSFRRTLKGPFNRYTSHFTQRSSVAVPALAASKKMAAKNGDRRKARDLKISVEKSKYSPLLQLSSECHCQAFALTSSVSIAETFSRLKTSTPAGEISFSHCSRLTTVFAPYYHAPPPHSLFLLLLQENSYLPLHILPPLRHLPS